jgi:DNA-binding transcriptional MocR family regulator
MKPGNDKGDLLYRRIASNIEHKIKYDVLKVGDKLPSIRSVCRTQGVSMSTACQAYFDLESKGLIESRPQSGYYVSYSYKKFPKAADTSNPVNYTSGKRTDEIIEKVYGELGRKGNLLLALGVPASELLPTAKLNKALMQAMRSMPGNGTAYEETQGNQNLRRQIARWSFTWDGKLDENDIITAEGCLNAISYCLMSLLQKGDTLAVESPVYFGILRLAKGLGLNVMELPTNPLTGVDLDALKAALEKKKINACLLISNFSNPVGSCMPDDHKKEVVRLMEKHNIPLIEDDLYGDVYFDAHRPKTCKSFDESGIVLWCSSVSKTLAPGYRVGWVAPGKFKDKIAKTKLNHSISSTAITHETIGRFLENGRYENHLRKLRQVLHTNSLQYLRAIGAYFPEETRVSHPKGGFMQWVELSKKTDTIELYELALKNKISIAPGRMFSLQNQYTNCLRLSYGLVWNEKVENGLKLLGKLAKGLG